MRWDSMAGCVAAVVVGCCTCLPGQVQAQALSAAAPAVLEVWKGSRQMELRHGETVMRRFTISLGIQPRQTKQVRGDNRTPVGRYYVCDKIVSSRFRRFLGLSYPNEHDAERGYGANLIDARQWADIFFANLHGAIPSWRTALGGRVGIHGFGGRPYLPVDWTQGCIAVADDEIDYLYDRVSVGTPVIINE